MKKTVLVLLLGIVLLAVFGTEANAQIPKEGTTSFTSGYSAAFKVLAMGQEHVQMTYEAMGANITDTDEDIDHNTTFRCIGAMHAVNGDYTGNNSAFCVTTRPDGDQIFSIFKFAGKIGAMYKGTYTIVGGTGKLVGIRGGGESTGIPLRPAAEGTFQHIERFKGQYKLP
jgi:hypothetical protein